MNQHPLDDDHSPIVASVVNQSATTDDRSTLKIWHLILLTTVIAALHALYQFLISFESEWLPSNEDQDVIAKIRLIVRNCISGSLIAGLIILVVQAIRRRRFIRQPGHWILLTQGLAALHLFGSFSVLVILIYQSDDFERGALVYETINSIGWLITIIAGTFFLIYHAKLFTWSWHAALVSMLVLASTQLTVSIIRLISFANLIQDWGFISRNVYYGSQVIQVVGLIFLVIAVINDIRQKNRRDWLHWLGVLSLFLRTVLDAINYAIIFFSN